MTVDKSQAKIAMQDHLFPYLKAIMVPGETYALRVLYPGKFSPNYEGVFTDTRSLAVAALEATETPIRVYDRQAGRQIELLPFGVYIVPNPVKSSLAARVEPNKLNVVEPDGAVKDGEVSRRTALLIDIDSVKDPGEDGRGVRGICATDAERDAALARTHEIVVFLRERGWPEPVITTSGNGGQLLYRIDMPNSAESDRLIKAVTQTLHKRFSSREADVDDAVHNASRLWRVPGTWNRKGRNTEERPHRRAELVLVPDGWPGELIQPDMLRALVTDVGDEAALKTLGGKAQPPQRQPAKTPERNAAPSRVASTSVARPARSERSEGQAGALVASAAETIMADLSWVEECVGAIDVNGPRGQWLSVGRALKGLLGEEGWQVYRDWSSSYGGSESTDRSTWDGLDGDAPEDATRQLMGIAKGYGWSYREWREANGVKIKAPKKAKPRFTVVEEACVDGEQVGGYVARSAPRIPQTTAAAAELQHPLSHHWLTNRPGVMYDEAVLCVAGTVMQQLRLCASPVRLGDKLLVCDPATYRWSEVSATDVAQMMSRWIGRVRIGDDDEDEKNPKFFSGRIPSQRVYTEALTCAPDVTHLRQQRGAQLVLNDGVIRPDDTVGEVYFEALRPGHFATYGYDLCHADLEGATCPRFCEYLEGLFPGALNPDLTVEYLLRWISLAIFGATIKFQAPAIILKGRAGTGKSTLGKIIEKLMPPGSTCSVPLQDWEHEYNRAELVGKLFNFVPELAIDEPIGGLDQVKKIIFGELTSARQIYAQVQSFYPTAAHLFCANGLPNMRKADPAVFKRFIQLEVTGKVVRGTRDENTEFDRELVDAELPGILRLLVAAFERASHDRLAKTPGTINGLPVLTETAGLNEEWRHKSDAVGVWLHEGYTFDAELSKNRSARVSDLYTNFKLWCQDNGYSLMNRGSFKQQLSNFYTIAQVNKQDVAVGCVPLPTVYSTVAEEDDVPL